MVLHQIGDRWSVRDFWEIIAYPKQLFGQLKFEGLHPGFERASYTEKKEGFMQIFKNLGGHPAVC
jgi:hypothetical protein